MNSCLHHRTYAVFATHPADTFSTAANCVGDVFYVNALDVTFVGPIATYYSGYPVMVRLLTMPHQKADLVSGVW
jgi:hypothetical protein